MAEVLVVDDSPLQARHLQFILQEGDFLVTVAGHGLEALEVVRRKRPDIVITDMHMPVMNGLELVGALRSEFPGLPVILCTSQGSEELAVEALKAGASSYVPKRRLADEIILMVEEVLSVASAQKKHAMFSTRMTGLENRFSLENDPDLVPQIVSHVEAVMSQLSIFDEVERVRVGVAVHEAVVNAIVHGNLGVDSELKAGDWEAYHEMIRTRRKQSPYQERTVTITIRADRRPYLEIRVMDQGPGFDISTVPDPTDPNSMERTSGRGLLLIRTFFDKVSHNPTGNEIIMIKGLSR
jgi:CheY-like chemotaxis protein